MIAGLTGGVAGSASLGANQIVKDVSHEVGNIFARTAAGAVLSGTTGALGCLLNNIMNLKKIDMK